MAKRKREKKIATLRHEEASRKNIPTAEFRSVLDRREQSPVQVAYERRNRDLDPQLVWRGKDAQDWSDLVVQAPPLFIQEKVHPKVLIDELRRQRGNRPDGSGGDGEEVQTDLFADFNGLPSDDARTEFYQHDANWSNRMILGDSLQVMASLAEREGLRGKVQCIYLDPPYGIKFNSNFQWSTTSRDVKDGKAEHISREPEQVKAFRDTWRDGIHSYLTYLRDRLFVARELLAESGSIFVQIGDENIHRVRALMDDCLGNANSVAVIAFKKTSGAGSISGKTLVVPQVFDYVVWYAKNKKMLKYRQLYLEKILGETGASQYQWIETEHFMRRRMTKSQAKKGGTGGRVFGADNLTSASGVDKTRYPVEFEGATYTPHPAVWKTSLDGMRRVAMARRLISAAINLSYVRYIDDFPAIPMTNFWSDTASSFMADKVYVVQTNAKVVERCILMTTDSGDLVLDPTCGSGTSAYVAEQWGRRWITIDTSRVALALARARIMGARYPYYTLADSPEGQRKEAEITRKAPSEAPTHGDVRQGFVYERVPHITLKSIANNAEIDVIWERWQETLEPLRDDLNARLERDWEEWQVPREASEDWPAEAVDTHRLWWEARIARQQEIDASIAAKADYEYLYDKPYEDGRKVRVAGPFTVESLSPHRVLAVDEDDELIDRVAEPRAEYGPQQDFAGMILAQLATAGVQQAHKEDRIAFAAVTPWPGDYICAEGRYREGDGDDGPEKRAGVFVGPEFGTVSRPDLVAAAREAGDAGFDVLIACAFNYEAHASEFSRLGRIPVLKARMNADLHMADELKNTGKGNLFVIFGEPDIDILPVDGEGAGDERIQVKINGVDVFHPTTGEVRSDGADGIACWFIDTDYNEESFFVRHAYFLGANDPYKALKTTLKAEIDADAWASLHSDISRPFDRPESGRIAVKVINHLGDEVMKVFRV
ncbi:MAG: site-specific DNA-methyltransferase [Acidobacteriia bacterium]|nr:site-specific DNA-methyltransferase [Terriglobia bacterium]